MAATSERYCTFLFHTEKASAVQQDEIVKRLESADINSKTEAIKQTIMLLLSGEQLPRVLMTVIRFCITTEDHYLKKLLMLYWEIVPKYSPDGKLLPEMILVCNALRNDLNHSNEYIRGSMLRFLCKLKEPELLEPLIPSIKQCLEHRHAYVRRNAALAVFSIHRSFGDQLLPDGADLMQRFISAETDISARRNAFLMLFNDAEHIAVDFLQDHIDDIHKFGDSFAQLVLELARKVCRRDPAQKARFVRCMFQLLQSTSAAVSYEAAWTLVSLSSAPTAVRAAAQTYAGLLTSQSDNNLRLIILERLGELKKHHGKIVQEILMDILRALSSPNIDICRKTLDVAMDLVSPRNIEEVMQVLKREVMRTQESDMDKSDEYRHLLVGAINTCATKFPDVAENVVQVLLDFLAGAGGHDIMLFTRTILEQYPHLREVIMRKICSNFDDISTASALRVALWVIGEYGSTEELLTTCVEEVMRNLGQPPFVEENKDGASATEVQTKTITKNVVLSDGTYATQTITQTIGGGVSRSDTVSPLRKFMCAGDVLLGTIAAATLTKLGIRAVEIKGELDESARNICASAVLTACAVARLAESKSDGRIGVYADCIDRLMLCCRVLLEPSVRAELRDSVLEGGRTAFAATVLKQKAQRQKDIAAQNIVNSLQADDLIQFRQLRAQAVQGGLDLDLMDGDDISRAVGLSEDGAETSQIKRVYQLTGYADPVYAEASVTVHDYDIVLDMLVVNRTPNTLVNLTVELATMGDLKLVERPQSHTIGPLDERRIKATIKVSSTETGHIFGTVVFDNSSSAQKTYVYLNDIQLDVMDYIRPATCTDHEFRSMWAEFEWENKVAINTSFKTLRAFLDHIVKQTNMTCLTPLDNAIDTSQDTFAGEPEQKETTVEDEEVQTVVPILQSNFLAANLYARSVFGEDALVNVSVEKKDDADGRLSGYIRIRSKTQGIALSLGDRITSVQKGPSSNCTPSAEGA